MPVYSPSLDDYQRLAGRGRTVPIYRRLMADQLTPVGAFARLAEGAEHAFLLESVIGGEQVARYSFVGARPGIVFRAKDRSATVERADGSIEVMTSVADPLAALQKMLEGLKACPRSDTAPGAAALPRFTGGAVGFAGYDTVRRYEPLPHAPKDDRGLDDLVFGIYEDMVIFDHVSKTVMVVAHARVESGREEAAYHDACRRIERLVETLNHPGPTAAGEFDVDARLEIAFESTFERDAFETVVRQAKEYIVAGDIFQVVLSQRLRATTVADPFDIYRALRVVNPSPFMFYIKSPQCVLVGASPEILCRVEDGVITNRPLAGTRRRGATGDEDAALEKELLADPKDRAEHIMLVDLGRNDVGRVAEPGSVELSDIMSIERYSHVMHISSTVTGRLAKGRTALDALRASLPVGTVSGAPKVRAMQIIDELEPVRRGPYGGAVGYVDFSDNMDTCIALRTMVITPGTKSGEWIVDMQAGAGIVADSDPAAEYEETMNKAKALLAAVAIANGG
ncbi:MAG TPA: anthranilate synthase component I [Phycisphaerae bacterium]|nr:anthranilate synthase component I [Phycisphaerae bacterium]